MVEVVVEWVEVAVWQRLFSYPNSSGGVKANEQRGKKKKVPQCCYWITCCSLAHQSRALSLIEPHIFRLFYLLKCCSHNKISLSMTQHKEKLFSFLNVYVAHEGAQAEPVS